MMRNQLLGLRLQGHLACFRRCEAITSHPPVLLSPWWTALPSRWLTALARHLYSGLCLRLTAVQCAAPWDQFPFTPYDLGTIGGCPKD